MTTEYSDDAWQKAVEDARKIPVAREIADTMNHWLNSTQQEQKARQGEQKAEEKPKEQG